MEVSVLSFAVYLSLENILNYCSPHNSIIYTPSKFQFVLLCFFHFFKLIMFQMLSVSLVRLKESLDLFILPFVPLEPLLGVEIFWLSLLKLFFVISYISKAFPAHHCLCCPYFVTSCCNCIPVFPDLYSESYKILFMLLTLNFLYAFSFIIKNA